MRSILGCHVADVTPPNNRHIGYPYFSIHSGVMMKRTRDWVLGKLLLSGFGTARVLNISKTAEYLLYRIAQHQQIFIKDLQCASIVLGPTDEPSDHTAMTGPCLPHITLMDSESHITRRDLPNVTAPWPAHHSMSHMLLIFSHPFPPCLFLLKNIDCRARSRFPWAVWLPRNTEEIDSYFTFYLSLFSIYYCQAVLILRDL